MENESTINGIPIDHDKVSRDFARCFCTECPRSQDCLRYLLGQTASPRPQMSLCVYPQSYQAGDCPYFRSAQPVSMAWGCSPLFHNVLARHENLLRIRIMAYLGSRSTYYRYEKGRYKLTPRMQADILAIFAEFGYDTADLRFQNYELTLDFSPL